MSVAALETFARLEVIADRQILAELVAADDGPKVRIRRDHSFTVEATRGPWPDNDEGWSAAEEYLRSVDLVKAAAQLDLTIARFSGASDQIEAEG